ncbi:MAG: DUF2135 domain-containing protein [Proteobacteria bacterium]|nr:DUF2135 domain-containing protein [Pseudomonadota bacterium]
MINEEAIILPVPRVPLVVIEVPSLLQEETAPRIGEYCIEAKIKGLYAHVTTEFTIHNDNHRTFEGELEFPLPDGGVVCGYAIDLQGVMTPASVVEKEKARIAFENEVKKGIDPGLVEQVRGNAYRTRIYPLPAKGSRRVRIEYLTSLVHGENGDAALYLPMPHTKLERRDVEIMVDMPDAPAPRLSGLGNHTFVQAQAVWRVETHDTDITPDDDLLIALPTLPKQFACLESHDGDTFFVASVETPVDDQNAHTVLPKAWRIIWDASGSRAEADIKAAIALLELLPKNEAYTLHVFRNTLEPVRTFADLDALLNAVRAVVYDGGTDYAPLQALARDAFDGMTLFFTDGLDTFIGALPEFGASSAAIVSSKMRDISVLRAACGGKVFDLASMTPKKIIENLHVTLPTICAVKGEGISDILGIGEVTTGRLTILGRLNVDKAQITLCTSKGENIEMTLDRAKAKEGRNLALAWAAKRVEALSPNADSHREELLAIGRHFSIVSPVSSMIVFERLEQWLEYDIEPPLALEALHKDWLEKHQQNKQSEELKRRNWLNSLDSEWCRRKEWWASPVPKIEKPSSGLFGQMRNVAQAVGGAMSSLARNAVPARLREAPMMMADRQVPHMESENMPGMGMASPSMAGNAAPMPPCMAERSVARAPIADDEDCCCEMCEACMDEEDSCDASDKASCDANNAGVITIQAWNSDMPYLKAIRDASVIFKDRDSLYTEYIKQRKIYASSPSFYLDCASLFFEQKEKNYAIRILSNLSELKLDDVALLRVYAWRLREAGELDLAIVILQKVAKIRPDEAVSFRDLALTYTLRAKRDHSAEDAEVALKYYKHVIETPCPRRDAIYTAVVAIEEFNALAAWCDAQNWNEHKPVMPELDEKYRQNLDTDIRIVLMWDADDTDIDLHVLEPSGEEVYYSNKRSASGGMLSYDVTTGYGPEEYLHKKAPSGTYKILSNYFASHQQKLTGPVTVTATVFTDWGRPNEKSQTMSLRLENAKDHVMIGEIKI